MSLSSILTDLTAARDRFITLLASHEVSVSANATLHQCLDALEALWNVNPGEEESRLPTTRLTLVAPDDLSLYAGESADAHYWSPDDELTVAVYNGETLLADDCTGYDGTEFVYGKLNYLCAGNRVLVELGPKPSGIDSATLTIKWLRGGTAVKTETREFDWFHTPQYFKRPVGEGNYKLKKTGASSAAEAEVYYAGSWMDFPSAGLSSLYAGCPVRLKTEPSLQTTVCWTCDGADGDPFWYLT